MIKFSFSIHTSTHVKPSSAQDWIISRLYAFIYFFLWVVVVVLVLVRLALEGQPVSWPALETSLPAGTQGVTLAPFVNIIPAGRPSQPPTISSKGAGGSGLTQPAWRRTTTKWRSMDRKVEEVNENDNKTRDRETRVTSL